ncbi:hypothetical protein BLA39750_01110 [Burkholderia lata]|uniref:Uncharacterized protein n=1 Tax=Burkholderia lata (strain ATCC 17760 / DSM 23089 / LMG 22485 / NCIMB 9086 / R18194 / 383) TaxID=482957 RepID=A0A6P2URK9_BURL3|nr:hypothetical protein [Burkholderia lata]VWC79815.1 hypothetical protein BLA39750_01110 [Burkholderia lata]
MNQKRTVEGTTSVFTSASRDHCGPYEALADDQKLALAYVYGKRGLNITSLTADEKDGLAEIYLSGAAQCDADPSAIEVFKRRLIRIWHKVCLPAFETYIELCDRVLEVVRAVYPEAWAEIRTTETTAWIDVFVDDEMLGSVWRDGPNLGVTLWKNRLDWRGQYVEPVEVPIPGFPSVSEACRTLLGFGENKPVEVQGGMDRELHDDLSHVQDVGGIHRMSIVARLRVPAAYARREESDLKAFATERLALASRLVPELEFRLVTGPMRDTADA